MITKYKITELLCMLDDFFMFLMKCWQNILLKAQQNARISCFNYIKG